MHKSGANRPLYTVQRARKDDSLYGPIHASDDATITMCGVGIDDKWWIVTNNHSGKVTCKACLSAL